MKTAGAGQGVAVIGGGPAGLMVAEILSAQGVQVDLYDAMPSVGRKFLLAGIGGMNITHSEPFYAFVRRYRDRQPEITALLRRFDADALRRWIHGLGIETFVGSSGRVFPTEMKAAPLLRAWLKRLRQQGVRLHVRHRWQGWTERGELRFETPTGALTLTPNAVVLALGGGSWAKLGSDGRWVPWLQQRGVKVQPLQPSNSGFEVAWSEHFRQRFAGEPVKPVAAALDSCAAESQRGEFVITDFGVEGGLIYALSAPLRQQLLQHGQARLYLDLAPGRSQSQLQTALAKPRGKDSFAKHLRRATGLEGVKAGLLREVAPREALEDPAQVARLIKAAPLVLSAVRPLDEAISSAGGVAFEELDGQLMIRQLPGVFCAGEMLDWEAPTGGYLLTACFASGVVAAEGVLGWLGVSKDQGT